MKNELEIFEFMGKRVRVAMFDGEPWFVANDVGKVLGISNVRDLISNVLDKDERIYVMRQNPSVGNSDIQKVKGQKLVAINESGLYTIIMRSTRPEAKAFRKWVTGEVLPSLRKTGRYEMQSEQSKPEVKEETPPSYSSDMCARLTLKNGIAIDIPANAGGYKFLSEIFKSLAMV